MNEAVPAKMSSVPPTAAMASVDLTSMGLYVIIKHLLNLLETQGPAVMAIVEEGLKLIELARERKMVQVWIVFRRTSDDVIDLIAAIKEEFGIE